MAKRKGRMAKKPKLTAKNTQGVQCALRCGRGLVSISP